MKRIENSNEGGDLCFGEWEKQLFRSYIWKAYKHNSATFALALEGVIGCKFIPLAVALGSIDRKLHSLRGTRSYMRSWFHTVRLPGLTHCPVSNGA